MSLLLYEESHIFRGNIRRDRFGRVVVDTCPSDVDHLRDSIVLPGDDRSRCRRVIEKAFDVHIGKKGRLKVTVEFEPEEDDTAT